MGLCIFPLIFTHINRKEKYRIEKSYIISIMEKKEGGKKGAKKMKKS